MKLNLKTTLQKLALCLSMLGAALTLWAQEPAAARQPRSMDAWVTFADRSGLLAKQARPIYFGRNSGSGWPDRKSVV